MGAAALLLLILGVFITPIGDFNDSSGSDDDDDAPDPTPDSVDGSDDGVGSGGDGSSDDGGTTGGSDDGSSDGGSSDGGSSDGGSSGSGGTTGGGYGDVGSGGSGDAGSGGSGSDGAGTDGSGTDGSGTDGSGSGDGSSDDGSGDDTSGDSGSGDDTSGDGGSGDSGSGGSGTDDGGDDTPPQDLPGAIISEDSATGAFVVELEDGATGTLALVSHQNAIPSEEVPGRFYTLYDLRLYLIPEGTDLPVGTANDPQPFNPEGFTMDGIGDDLGFQEVGFWFLGAVLPDPGDPEGIAITDGRFSAPQIVSEEPIQIFRAISDDVGNALISVLPSSNTDPFLPGETDVTLGNPPSGTPSDFTTTASTVTGTTGSDFMRTVASDATATTLQGAGGADVLIGGVNDVVRGGESNDLMQLGDGGRGEDGQGNDIFVMDARSDIPATADIIGYSGGDVLRFIVPDPDTAEAIVEPEDSENPDGAWRYGVRVDGVETVMVLPGESAAAFNSLEIVGIEDAYGPRVGGSLLP